LIRDLEEFEEKAFGKGLDFVENQIKTGNLNKIVQIKKNIFQARSDRNSKESKIIFFLILLQ